jgi:hypothetical protein
MFILEWTDKHWAKNDGGIGYLTIYLSSIYTCTYIYIYICMYVLYNMKLFLKRNRKMKPPYVRRVANSIAVMDKEHGPFSSYHCHIMALKLLQQNSLGSKEHSLRSVGLPENK